MLSPTCWPLIHRPSVSLLYIWTSIKVGTLNLMVLIMGLHYSNIFVTLWIFAYCTVKQPFALCPCCVTSHLSGWTRWSWTSAVFQFWQCSTRSRLVCHPAKLHPTETHKETNPRLKYIMLMPGRYNDIYTTEAIPLKPMHSNVSYSVIDAVIFHKL